MITENPLTVTSTSPWAPLTSVGSKAASFSVLRKQKNADPKALERIRGRQAKPKHLISKTVGEKVSTDMASSIEVAM